MQADYGISHPDLSRGRAAAWRHQVSSIAKEMMALVGDWSNTERMVQNFGNRQVRVKLGALIDRAETEDEKAFGKIEELKKFL